VAVAAWPVWQCGSVAVWWLLWLWLLCVSDGVVAVAAWQRGQRGSVASVAVWWLLWLWLLCVSDGVVAVAAWPAWQCGQRGSVAVWWLLWLWLVCVSDGVVAAWQRGQRGSVASVAVWQCGGLVDSGGLCGAGVRQWHGTRVTVAQ
jgi:hypothetical protein